MIDKRKQHIWIYAYRDNDIPLIHYCYIHDMYIEEELKLPPLQEPWHWCISSGTCDCEIDN